MKKIPKKYEPIVAGLLMSSMMGFIMSGIITAINMGFGENFISLWLGAFIKAVPIAFCAVILVRPIIEKFIKKYIE